MKGDCLATLLPFMALPAATQGPFICLLVNSTYGKLCKEGNGINCSKSVSEDIGK